MIHAAWRERGRERGRERERGGEGGVEGERKRGREDHTCTVCIHTEEGQRFEGTCR